MDEVKKQFALLKLNGTNIENVTDADLENALVLAECLKKDEKFIKSLLQILLKPDKIDMQKIVDQNKDLQKYLDEYSNKTAGGKKSRIKRKTRKSYTKKYRGGDHAEIPAIIFVLLVVLLVKKLSDATVGILEDA